MSQHYFETTYANRPVTVTLGWDRPLGHFFMFIEKNDAAEDEVEILYSNLNLTLKKQIRQRQNTLRSISNLSQNKYLIR